MRSLEERPEACDDSSNPNDFKRTNYPVFPVCRDSRVGQISTSALKGGKVGGEICGEIENPTSNQGDAGELADPANKLPVHGRSFDADVLYLRLCRWQLTLHGCG